MIVYKLLLQFVSQFHITILFKVTTIILKYWCIVSNFCIISNMSIFVPFQTSVSSFDPFETVVSYRRCLVEPLMKQQFNLWARHLLRRLRWRCWPPPKRRGQPSPTTNLRCFCDRFCDPPWPRLQIESPHMCERARTHLFPQALDSLAPGLDSQHCPGLGSSSCSAKWAWDRPESGCHRPILDCRILYLHTGLVRTNIGSHLEPYVLALKEGCVAAAPRTIPCPFCCANWNPGQGFQESLARAWISYQNPWDSKRAGRNNVIIACGTLLSFCTLCAWKAYPFTRGWSDFFVPEAHFMRGKSWSET